MLEDDFVHDLNGSLIKNKKVKIVSD